jgi:hypothetical protein
MKIVRRLDPQAHCGMNNSCPAAFLLDTGDIALIGTKAGLDLENSVQVEAGIGPEEALITVPRDLLIALGWALPEH